MVLIAQTRVTSTATVNNVQVYIAAPAHGDGYPREGFETPFAAPATAVCFLTQYPITVPGTADTLRESPMRGLKALLGTTALLLAPLAVMPAADAQVVISIQPTCSYGYYDYAPYACAPVGFYGPGYFYNGIFLGMGPWAGWGYSHGWGSHRFSNGGGGRYTGRGGSAANRGHAGDASTVRASNRSTSRNRATAGAPHATAVRGDSPHGAAVHGSTPHSASHGSAAHGAAPHAEAHGGSHGGGDRHP